MVCEASIVTWSVCIWVTAGGCCNWTISEYVTLKRKIGSRPPNRADVLWQHLTNTRCCNVFSPQSERDKLERKRVKLEFCWVTKNSRQGLARIRATKLPDFNLHKLFVSHNFTSKQNLFPFHDEIWPNFHFDKSHWDVPISPKLVSLKGVPFWKPTKLLPPKSNRYLIRIYPGFSFQWHQRIHNFVRNINRGCS